MDRWIDSTVHILYTFCGILDRYPLTFYTENHEENVYLILMIYLLKEYQGDTYAAAQEVGDYFKCTADPRWPTYLEKYILPELATYFTPSIDDSSSEEEEEVISLKRIPSLKRVTFSDVLDPLLLEDVMS